MQYYHQAALGVILHDVTDIWRIHTCSHKDSQVIMAHILHLKM